MKKKIVINVPMHNDKAKSKAMKIGVAIQGVMSVSIGEDELVVIGEGVDSVCLANSLRKKFCFANITSLDDVKQAGQGSSPSPSPASSPSSSPPKQPPWQYCQPPTYYPPVYCESRPVYDAYPPHCSIL